MSLFARRFITFSGVALASAAASTSAFADFAGQPILGPITAGSNVVGDLTGKADDNDGWFSGEHIFDIWDGGDDVWQLNWAGGDLILTLTYSAGDPDLSCMSPAASMNPVSIPSAGQAPTPSPFSTPPRARTLCSSTPLPAAKARIN